MTAGDVRRALLHGTTSELIKERLELVKEGSFRQARAISACACAEDSTLGEEKLSWDGLSGGGGRKYPKTASSRGGFFTRSGFTITPGRSYNGHMLDDLRS